MTSCLDDALLPALAGHGIKIVDYEQLETPTRLAMEQYFQERVFPVLTPLAIDAGHPFPYISTLSLSLAVELRERRSSGDVDYVARVGPVTLSIDSVSELDQLARKDRRYRILLRLKQNADPAPGTASSIERFGIDLSELSRCREFLPRFERCCSSRLRRHARTVWAWVSHFRGRRCSITAAICGSRPSLHQALTSACGCLFSMPSWACSR